MDAKNIFLFLIAAVIFQITNAIEPKSSIDLLKRDEYIYPRVFKCPETGVFPDLEDCLTLHFCIPSKSLSRQDFISITCDNGFGYDPKTSRCTLPLYNGYCPEIIPECQTAYQMGPLFRNPSLYYVCVPSDTGLIPEVYVCPMDHIHNGTSCVSNTPPSGLDSSGLCIKAGAFYYPDDCTKHRYCPGPGMIPIERHCSDCYKFNWKTEKCEMFNCDNHNV